MIDIAIKKRQGKVQSIILLQVAISRQFKMFDKLNDQLHSSIMIK